MLPQASSNQQPFWEDELDPYSTRPVTSQRWFNVWAVSFSVLITLFILCFSASLFAYVSPTLAWAWLILMAFPLVLALGGWRRGKRQRSRIEQTQERARLLTGASHIGSAVHVAGHPLLAREQRVVLALTDGHLSFYGYDSPTPIDTLPVVELRFVHTIVYDDERIPHFEVIDSTAQALELVFTRNGETWTCLFKQMRKIRPIDWYHAIQQARFSALRVSQPISQT
jgi:hypothetical protein